MILSWRLGRLGTFLRDAAKGDIERSWGVPDPPMWRKGSKVVADRGGGHEIDMCDQH